LPGVFSPKKNKFISSIIAGRKMNKYNAISKTILKGLACLICVNFLHSCSNGNNNNDSPKPIQETNDTMRRKPPSSFSDTLIISFPSAVFYNSDSLQLEKTKAITSVKEYKSEVHNCFYMMRNARMELKKYWPKIHIIETSLNRYLLFVKAGKSKSLIDLDGKGDMCGIFLFDGKKEPELADMMNIDTALGFYFEK
jgi:hypothetical protein